MLGTDREETIDKIESVRAKLASAEEFLAGWPHTTQLVPRSVHGTATVAFQEFRDSPLLLIFGIGPVGSFRAAWCLFNAAGNRAGSEPGAPVEIPATLSDPARRALQLFAVDQREAEEAASAELAEAGVAGEIAQMAVAVGGRISDSDFVEADLGATVHAVLAGTDEVDVILVGAPIWIGAL